MSDTAVKIGDYFVRSWGYDQTNINFYRVVGLTPSGKSVRLQEVTKITAEDRGPVTYVIPGNSVLQVAKRVDGVVVTNDYGRAIMVDGPVITKRLDARSSTPRVSNARLWDGRPQYETGSGWGH